MEPGVLYINLYRGAIYQEVLRSYGPDGKTPDDFTGYSAVMRVFGNNNKLLAELTVGNGEVAFGPELNQITFTLAAARTAELPVGKFSYYIDLIPPAHDPIRFMMGTANIA